MKHAPKWIPISVLLLSLLLAAMLWLRPPETGADMAAWAQAVTTVVALVAALFLPFHQHERDERLRRTEQARTRASRLESVFQLAAVVLRVCKEVTLTCQQQQGTRVYFTNAVGEVQAIRSMLGKFDPSLFNGYPELDAAVSVMAAADAMAGHLDHAARLADQYDQNRSMCASFAEIGAELVGKVHKLGNVAESARRDATALEGTAVDANSSG
jgi:hypothetical protein